MKKFELTAGFVTSIFGKKLFRIKALVAFGNVEKGELGGFVEKEENLSQNGDAVVSGSAWSPATRIMLLSKALADIIVRLRFSAAMIKFSAYSAAASMVT